MDKRERLVPMPICTKPMVEGVVPLAKDMPREPSRDPFPGWVGERPPTCCRNPDKTRRPYLIFRQIETATGRWFPLGESMYPIGEIVEWDFSLQGMPSPNKDS